MVRGLDETNMSRDHFTTSNADVLRMEKTYNSSNPFVELDKPPFKLTRS
jgi:hypothetical protein